LFKVYQFQFAESYMSYLALINQMSVYKDRKWSSRKRWLYNILKYQRK